MAEVTDRDREMWREISVTLPLISEGYFNLLWEKILNALATAREDGRREALAATHNNNEMWQLSINRYVQQVEQGKYNIQPSVWGGLM